METIFTEHHRDSSCLARTGTLQLPHGKVSTPVFMPVGTNGTVKAMTKDKLAEIGFEIILANTYHLYLRPGTKVIESQGGLHGFSGFKGNFLTDSGGFQVFSLAPFRKITNEGVKFKSHIDGSSHILTPENVVASQVSFQSDIMMQLDVCTKPGITHKEAVEAMNTTTAWAKRCKSEWLNSRDKTKGYLFGILQGNFFKDLREQHAKEMLEIDFPGIAVGGLSVGESYEVFTDMLAHTGTLLPQNRVHYLMGIGTPEYIFEAVQNGIDMFDCVFPTRVARNGLLFSHSGPITIKKSIYEFDSNPIDSECNCNVCKNYSRSYLRHLFRTQEILYSMLATEHNLYFLKDLIDNIRLNIEKDTFLSFKKDFLYKYSENKKDIV